MPQGLLDRHVGEPLERDLPKRPPRGRENDQGDAIERLADQALEDRAVLAVDGENPRATASGRGQQRLARGDDELLVRAGDAAAGDHGREDRIESDGAVGGGEHDMGSALRGHRTQTRLPDLDPRAWGDGHAKRGEIRVGGARHERDLEVTGLPRQLFDTPSRSAATTRKRLE